MTQVKAGWGVVFGPRWEKVLLGSCLYRAVSGPSKRDGDRARTAHHGPSDKTPQSMQPAAVNARATSLNGGKVDIGLPEKGDANCHGARPVR